MTQGHHVAGAPAEIGAVPTTLLRVEDLVTSFATQRGPVPAVDGVSLELQAGEILGVVGESGSGKTMLTRSIMGLHSAVNIDRSEGRVLLNGVDLRGLSPRRLRQVWGSQIGIIFQDPMVSLNPVKRIGHQITETLALNVGISGNAARKRAVELLGMVGVADAERRLGEYPHKLSGGQRQRVAIAIAIAAEPDLLIADEPTTGLDVTVQAQILDLLRRLREEQGMAIIIVTHDLGVVAGFADRIAVMYAGQLVEDASTRRFFAEPRTPYAEALLASSPTAESNRNDRLPVIPGRPPNLADLPPACRFAPRCPYVQDRCVEEAPPLERDDSGHAWRCWFPRHDPERTLMTDDRVVDTKRGEVPDGR